MSGYQIKVSLYNGKQWKTEEHRYPFGFLFSLGFHPGLDIISDWPVDFRLVPNGFDCIGIDPEASWTALIHPLSEDLSDEEEKDLLEEFLPILESRLAKVLKEVKQDYDFTISIVPTVFK
jgi:hypothetical protein